MSRFDRAVFWLVNRVPLRFVVCPMGLIPWAIFRRTHFPFWCQLLAILGSAFAIGHFMGKWFIAWWKGHNFGPCFERGCFRPGRWMVRVTFPARDWEPFPVPHSYAVGCFCDRHQAAGISTFINIPGAELLDDFSVVPFDRVEYGLSR